MIMKRPTFENSPILAIIRGSYIIRHPPAVAMLKRITWTQHHNKLSGEPPPTAKTTKDHTHTGFFQRLRIFPITVLVCALD